MEGYTSKLTLDGIEGAFDILGGGVNFSRATDMKGRPASHVMGGQMSFSVEVTDKVDLVMSMLDPMNKVIKKGELSFTDAGDDNKVMRKVEFENAYIVQYSEAFSAGGSAFMCSFTLSAEKVKVAEAELDNRWPVKS